MTGGSPQTRLRPRPDGLSFPPGMGFCASSGRPWLLHCQVAEAVEAGTLQIVPGTFEPDPVPVHLVHAVRGQLPLKMRRFLDVAAPRLRERLDGLASAARDA